MKRIEELGESIENLWRNVNYSEGAFSEIAASALSRFECSPELMYEVTDWALGDHSIPLQLDSEAMVGEPSICIYVNPLQTFCIQALVCLDPTPSVRQYDFCGAFKVLQGQSLDVRYSFDGSDPVNSRIVFGNLTYLDAALLSAGDVRSIERGNELIRSAFNLERPTVTLVVRTFADATSGPQYEYLHPWLAVDPLYKSPRLQRNLQILTAIHQVDRARYIETLGCLIPGADLYTTYRYVRHYFESSPVAEDERERMTALVRAVHGDRGEKLIGCLDDLGHANLLLSTRNQLRDPGHRFFVALLLNVPHRDAILRLIGSRCPGNAVEQVVTWIHELCDGTDAPLSRLALPESKLYVLKSMVRGPTLEHVVQDLHEAYEAEDVNAQLDRVTELYDELRTRSLFRPVLRYTRGMEPTTVAARLREIAAYLDVDGEHHHSEAYDQAARSVEAAKGLQRLLDEGKLGQVANIDVSIAETIGELSRRGSASVLERLRAKWPAVIVELAHLPAIGAQTARRIHEVLRPAHLDAVAAAARAGQLRTLPGFDKVSEQKIFESIEEWRTRGAREIHMDAEWNANALAAYLRAHASATRVEVAGQVRRWCELVDHLTIAVETHQRDAVIARIASYGLVTSVDRSRAVIAARLASGMRADIHLAERSQFGWTLVCATGSPEHVEQLEARARARGVVLSRLHATDEADVYLALGLPYLPPEVRDGSDELIAADAGDDFSDLVALPDVTTAFHCHTTYSDGKNSIAEMARAAGALGMQAITITDHSLASANMGGLGIARLREQHAEIASLRTSPVRILRGTEADILADGSIDVPAEILPELDVVIASVHRRYKADEDAFTKRLVAAMRQPMFKIWGHALGRLMLRRDPIPVRLEEVLDAVAESRAAIEINGDPYRLDLDPVNARRASARGIQFVLSGDAHSTRGLTSVRWAVAMARRARIRKRQVLNALPPDELVERVRPIA